MTTANTRDVFRWALGKRVIGLYFDASAIAGEVAVLVLDDKTAVAFAGNGSHWTVSAEEVARHVADRKGELARMETELREVLRTEAVLEGL